MGEKDRKSEWGSENGVGREMERYSITETLVREDILAKARELAELIADSDDVKAYRQAEAKIKENAHVQSLIAAIKKKQKEAVAFEHTFKNPEMVKKIEAEIAALQDELDSIPIVQQFQQLQSDLNQLLQLVIRAVRDTVSEKIELESGN